MKKSEQREEKRDKNEFAEWIKICRHFFPNLPKWLNGMNDPRDTRYITYKQAVLVFMCIMKNVNGVVTMRNMNTQFNEDAAISNLAYISDEAGLDEMPDWQTANNYLEKLSPTEIDSIRRKMIEKLLRSKQFDRYKLNGCWKIILDGTGYAYFKERHCEHDLVTTVTDPETGKQKKYYYHKVLEAKVVLAPDLVISIDTEFIENEKEDVEKQDCELRAAKRLIERLKKNYPRLPICILADGLYAVMPFMAMCRGNKWSYLLNLKDGRQHVLSEDFKLFVEDDKFRFVYDGLCGEENGCGAFRNHMEKVSLKEEICNVFEYRHSVEQEGETKEIRFVWVTNIKITKENLEEMIYAGRSRWKIENEGFNNQKNGIYEIEHLCSKDPNAMKNHYLITQIADSLMQLYLAFGKMLPTVKRSVKSISARLSAYFCYFKLTPESKEEIDKKTAYRLQYG